MHGPDLRRTTLRRSAAAFVLAPPLGAGAYTVLFGLASWAGNPAARDVVGDLGSIGAIIVGVPMLAIAGMIFGSIAAYPGMLLFGLPCWIVMRGWRGEFGLGYALHGAAGGALFPEYKTGWTIFGEPYWLHNAIAGALVLYIFWRIAVERGPKL